MADQIMAQTGALKDPTSVKRVSRSRVGRMLERGWNFARAWVYYRLFGARRGMEGLLDLVIGDHFFAAWQVPDELRSLGELLANLHPEHALEIGTASGGTLLFLTRLASPEATIVSIDLPSGRFGGGYAAGRRSFYQHFARRKQVLHLFQEDSHSAETLSRVKAMFGGQPLDYLFIDGDHAYEGVKSDFEMYGPLVRKGGLIAFHDIVEGKPEMVGGVPQFWREVRSGYNHSEFISDPLQGGWGIGVLHID